MGEAQLRAAAEVVQNLASDEDPALQVLSGSYASARRFLPALLESIVLDGTPSAKLLLDTRHFLQTQHTGSRNRLKWAEAPRAVVPKSWARRVFPAKGEVNPQAYTLCVLDQLHQARRCREVFAPTSERYADPRAELLRGEAWEAAREAVARVLNRSTDPAMELDRLRQQLRATY